MICFRVTPFIAGIKDEVTILGSLQRPRKITLRGSDGLSYEMMCKDKVAMSMSFTL